MTIPAVRSDQIMAKISERIRASLPLKTFIDTHFPGGKIYTAEGIKNELNFKEENTPLVAFSTIERTEKGDSAHDETFGLMVGTAIFDEADYVVTDTAATATTPEISERVLPGRKRSEEIRTIIENEILGLKGITAKIKIDGENLFEDAFPIFKSTGTVTFTFKKSMRTGSRR